MGAPSASNSPSALSARAGLNHYVLSSFRWKHLSVTLTGWFCLLSIGEGEDGFHHIEEAGIKGLEELGSSNLRWSAETVNSTRLVNGKDTQLFLKDTIDVKETQRSDFGSLNSTKRNDKISRGGRSMFPMDRGKCCG